MPDGHVQDPFKEVAAFLVEIGKLDQTDADIYALGLKKFEITSADVMSEIPKLRQNTAGGHLNYLSRNGFFECTVSESRKNAAKKFKAVPPSIALKTILSASARLEQILGMIDEHYENLAGKSFEEDIWLSNSDDVSILRAAAMIRAANNNLRICSNDCSWLEEQEIEDALSSLSGRANISVVANPNQEILEKFKKIGAVVRRVKETGIPFCVIDDKTLLMASQAGALRTRHILMSTTQPYMLKKYIELFDRFARHSKPIR